MNEHVLMLSLDKNLLNSEGEVFARHLNYASHFKQCTIIVLCSGKEKLKAISEGNLRIIPTNSITKWHALLDAVRIGRQCISPKVKTVITTQDPFITGLAGLWIHHAHKNTTRLNVQVHTDITSEYWREESLMNRAFWHVSKHVLRQASTIRVVSPATWKWLVTKYPEKTVRHVVISTDFSKWPVQRPVITGTRLITVCRLSSEKNVLGLVRAFQKVKRAIPQATLTIVGEGAERKKIEALVQQLSLESSVQLRGQQSHEQIKQALNNHDAFVLFSNYEGWGVVVVEAMASGLPVIMTRTGCEATLLVNDVTGLSVGVGNEEELARAITKILKNPDHARTIGLAASQYVRQALKNNTTEEWIELLKTT